MTTRNFPNWNNAPKIWYECAKTNLGPINTEQNNPRGNCGDWLWTTDQSKKIPIVDLKSYNTDGKEIQFIKIIQVIEKVTGEKTITEDTIKKAEFNFMLDLKTLITKS